VPPDSPKLQSNDAVETAISQVLTAEVEARDAVAHARGEAAAIAEQARETARRLGLRADGRIHAVRAAFDAKTTAAVAALEAQAAALNTIHDLTPAEISTVERAVAALAGAMTGGSS
jgi:regulator of protease activity HflC (stomatin/prohibitin superfamily)